MFHGVSNKFIWFSDHGARNRGLGRSGTPPARHDDLAARSSLHGSGGNAGDGSAAPGRKPPRGSAERRASRVMGRAAPHQRGSVASRKRDNNTSATFAGQPFWRNEPTLQMCNAWLVEITALAGADQLVGDPSCRP